MSEPQPSLEDCLRLIEAVMAFEPSVYLFGGVAEDAMLHGSWVRPHDDIDVFRLEARRRQRIQQYVALLDHAVALAQLGLEERANAGLEKHRLAGHRSARQRGNGFV